MVTILERAKICTFCGASTLCPAFVRDSRPFVKCRACRAFLQVIPDANTGEEIKLYDEFELGEFAANIELEFKETPDRAKLLEFERCLRGGSLLEIGPGTGHFLAAARDAGFSVVGVETSPYHRDYIHRKWNIQTLTDPLEKNTVLAPESFDNIVSFNCLEHIIDPAAHFAAAFRVLKPGGRLLISTCNADALVPRIAGRYGCMFKPPDHVSIPSPKSLHIVGERAGFQVIRIWCSEYPLETPLGFAVAMRDWLNDRWQRTRNIPFMSNSPPANSIGTNSSTRPISAGRMLGRRLIKAKAFIWFSALTSRFMLAGSVKALYEKPYSSSCSATS